MAFEQYEVNFCYDSKLIHVVETIYIWAQSLEHAANLIKKLHPNRMFYVTLAGE